MFTYHRKKREKTVPQPGDLPDLRVVDAEAPRNKPILADPLIVAVFERIVSGENGSKVTFKTTPKKCLGHVLAGSGTNNQVQK